jgi:hypothetical protein
MNYIDQSMRLYRRVRQRVRDLLVEVRQAGFSQVRLVGEGDIADICRLTCLEQGVDIADRPGIPAIEVRGFKVLLFLQGVPSIDGSPDGNQVAQE